MGRTVAERPGAPAGTEAARLARAEPRIGTELAARALLMLAGGPCAARQVAERTGGADDEAAAALTRLTVAGFATARPMMGTTLYAITARGRQAVSRTA